MCAKCLKTLSIELFHKSSRSKDGRCSYCKSCAKQSVNEWKKDNPIKRAVNQRLYYERHRNEIKAKQKANAMNNPDKFKAQRKIYAKRNRLKWYGLTQQTLADKLSAQGGVCAICSKEISLDSAVIDHCHSSGNTRDLLCSPCNLSLGHIERVGFLEKALAYIERHRTKG